MDVIVVGTGGLAREFFKFFSNSVNIIGFSSNSQTEFEKFNLRGNFYGNDITPQIVETKYCVIAIGNPNVKKKLSQKLKTNGFVFPNLVHTSSIIGSEIKPSNEGVIISPNCIVGPDVTFGNHIYLNFMVGIGHDTVLGNYIQVNPGSQIGGASIIEDGVLIGSGSTLRQKIKIKRILLLDLVRWYYHLFERV